MMKQHLLCLCLSVLSTSLTAQVKIWDGGGGTVEWGESDNWNPDVTPIPGDSVIISGASVVLDGIDPKIKSLLLLNNADLTIEAGHTISFSGSLFYAIRAQGSHVVNDGTIVISDVGDDDFHDRAIELLDSSTFRNNNSCTIMQSKGPGIWLDTMSEVTNRGNINIHSEGSPIRVDKGHFSNEGNIVITENGFYVSGIVVTGQFINTGMIDMSLPVSNLSGIALIGGLFTNTGSIDISANDARGIHIWEMASKFDLDAGSINITNSNYDGILITDGTLTIKDGAELKISGPSTYGSPLILQLGAELSCQGVIDLDD